MNPRATLLTLCPALLITACMQRPAPPNASVPTVPAVPTAPVTPSPEPTRTPLNNLGLIDVTFSGLSDREGPTVTARPHLSAAALTDQGSVQLKLVSNGTFTTGTRGTDGMRYLYATFQVRNANSSGTAYPTARQNLTLVAVSTASTINSTPVSRLQRFDGTDASASIAPTILPTTGLQLNRPTQQPELMPGAQDLQAYAENEVSTLTGGGITRAFPYGFVVRHRTQTNTRTLPANPAVNTYDGVVTIAVKLPMQATAADDPYTFNMTFAAVDDNVTRVTESVEEQAGGTVGARATALSAQVAVLCGSTYSTNPLFIGSVTTAGAPGTRAAHIGGDVALKSLPTAYAATGNVTLNANAASGLNSFYNVYPPTPGGTTPTLTFSGNGTARGGTLTMNADGSFAFTSKAGDGAGATLTRNAGDTFTFSGGTPTSDSLRYGLSTSSGCTTSNQTAPVNVNGRVWFVNGAGAGGDGRQTSPFNTVSGAQTASATNDLIYVAGGTYSQPTTFALKNNQAAVGAGRALVVNGTTIQAAGTAPLLQVTGGAGVTLASNNTLTGLGVQGSTDGITGTNFGTFNGTLTQIKALSGTALKLENGTASVTTTRVDSSSNLSNGVGIRLSDVTGNLTVSGSGTPGSGGTLQNANMGVSIATGAGNMNLNLSRMAITGNTTGVVFAPLTDSSPGALNLNIQNAEFLNNTSVAVQLTSAGSGNHQFRVENSSVTNTGLGAGFVYASSTAGVNGLSQGHLVNNTITFTPGSNASGISLYQSTSGSARWEVVGNTITDYGFYGINVTANDGPARLDAIVTGNSVRTTNTTALDAIALNSGSSVTQNSVLCSKVTGNTLTPPAGFDGIVVRQRLSNTFQLDGLSSPTTAALGTANSSTVRVRNPTEFAPQTATCLPPN